MVKGFGAAFEVGQLVAVVVAVVLAVAELNVFAVVGVVDLVFVHPMLVDHFVAAQVVVAVSAVGDFDVAVLNLALVAAVLSARGFYFEVTYPVAFA